MLLPALILGLCAACNDSEFNEFPTGDGNRVYLTLNTEPSVDVTVTRAANETDIYIARLLAFDSDGKCFYNEYLDDGNTSTLYTDRLLSLPVQAGSQYEQCTIWAIANIAVWSQISQDGSSLDFDNINTLDEFKAKYGRMTLNASSTPRSCIPMSGYIEGINLTAPNSIATPTILSLERILAKVTFKIDVANGLEFYFNTWSVENLPCYSYVAKNDKDYYDNNPEAVEAFYPSPDFTNNYTTSTINTWYGEGQSAGNNTNSYSFYTYENRRGNRIASPNIGNMTGEENEYAQLGSITDATGTDPKYKTLYAPEHATFLIITGLIRETATKNVRSFAYRIALGANNYNNYNLERNHSYTYNIHINGIEYDDISVDAFDSRVHKAYALLIDAPSLDRVDAHYDTRHIDIAASPGDITLQLYPTQDDAVASTNNITRVDWVSLSTKDVYNIGLDKDEATVLQLKSDDANFHHHIYIYTQENTGTNPRSVVLKVTHTPTPGSSEIVEKPVDRYYTITQVGLIENNGIGVESYEEYNMRLNPTYTGNLATEGLQWGWDKIDFTGQNYIATDASDGYANSTNILKYASNNPGTTAFEGVEVQSLYNTYAARYCYNKNRRNAKGEVEEVEWYLPALDQVTSMHTNSNITGMNGKSYWTSTVPTKSDTNSNPITADDIANSGIIGGLIQFLIGRLWDAFYNAFVDTGGENGDFYYTRVAKTVQDGEEGRYTVYYTASIGNWDFARVPVRVYNPRTDRTSTEFGALNGKNHIRCVRRLPNNP